MDDEPELGDDPITATGLFGWLSEIVNSVSNLRTSLLERLGNIVEALQGLASSISQPILDFLSDLGRIIIDALTQCFVPTYHPMALIRDIFDLKFSFIDEIREDLETFSNYSDGLLPPSLGLFTITLDNYHGVSGQYSVMEYTRYLPLIDSFRTFVSVMLYLSTLFLLYRRLPSLIGGISS